MNGAEFRTLRSYLGLSLEQIAADLGGVNLRTAQRWERKEEIPEHVQRVVDKYWQYFSDEVAKARTLYAQLKAVQDETGTPAIVELKRYGLNHKDDDLAQIDGIPVGVHNALQGALAMEAQIAGIRAIVRLENI